MTSPWSAFAFGLAAFASLGLLGFATFAGEMTILFGAFKPAAGRSTSNFSLASVFALWGVVIPAIWTAARSPSW